MKMLRIAHPSTILICVVLAISSTVQAEPARRLESDLGHSLNTITVPVDFKSGAVAFMVDTGATITAIDPSLWPAIGAKDQRNADEPQLIDEELQFKVGQFEIALKRFVVMDLENVRDAQQSPVMGILGMDALKNLCLSLDSDNRKCIISDEVPDWRLPHEASLSLIDGDRPFCVARINGKSLPFMIDTGSMSGLSVAADVFDELREGDIAYSPERLLRVDGQQQGRYFSSVSKWRMGPLETGPVWMAKGSRKTDTNTLGLLILARLNFSLDFQAKTIKFGPSKLLHAKDCSDRSGLVLFPGFMNANGLQTVVAYVRKDSDADRAGIRPNDLLFRVEWPSVHRFEGYEVYRSLTLPRPTPFRIHFKRGDKTLEAELEGGGLKENGVREER